MKSDAVVLDEDQTLSVQTFDVPALQDDHLRLQVDLVGICGSDVHMWKNDLGLAYPVLPGHEFVATVDAIGDKITTDSAHQSAAVGDAVTVVPGISCGECWYCTTMPTRPLTCNTRDVHGFRSIDDPPTLHGGMSQYFVLEDRAHWYILPDTIDRELGALVEPLAVASHAVERALPPGLPHVHEGLGIGQSVVIQGAGPIGLLTAATARAVGAGQVIMVDMIEDRLSMAERFGATETINLGEYDSDEFIDEIADRTPSGDGPDVVIEAVGRPEAFEQALQIPHNGGTVVEVGHYFSAGEAKIDPSDLIHRQLDVYGSLAYPPSQFNTAIGLLEATIDRFPYADLFNHRVGINDANEAFEVQAAGEAYRATIDLWK